MRCDMLNRLHPREACARSSVVRAGGMRWLRLACRVAYLTPLAVIGSLASWALAGDIERPPINYATATANNCIARLQQRIDAGQTQLAFEDRVGYLRSLLNELNISSTSQMLVFSKTSFQRQRISPRMPRAVYFNDEAYVGFCQKGNVLEITAADPQLGAVFYSLDQKPAAKPHFVRQNDSCLICHASSANQGLPGHLVRSVYTDDSGQPVLSLGTHRIDQRSPLKDRWGGWYVTGTSGKQTHLGNLIVNEERQAEQIVNADGVNLTDLKKRCNTAGYLTPHSDIVALMVLEHQTEMHNLITRANFLTRMTLHETAEINKALGRPADEQSESTIRRIGYACEPLVQYMLFSGETPLTDPIHGTSDFAPTFEKKGPRDARGRTLRAFDLEHRLFKYPCSYLIYSDAFDGLPGTVKEYVYRRLFEVLSGKDTSTNFAHLSEADRNAIREILIATKPDLPTYWHEQNRGQ